jgi:DNA modification methylase
MGREKPSGTLTRHTVHFSDSRRLDAVADASVDLVVTSPPYPLIGMWDAAFSAMSPDAARALEADDGPRAFEACHAELDRVWAECFRALRPGSLACVNVGDAVRTIGGEFRLYSNHARILSAMAAIGFSALPDVLWRKPTNAPNKFMGSGMLPAGAYVTYEHEYVLILRKGGKRAFAPGPEHENRRRSAFFWEERNAWFSDVWTDLKGTGQGLADAESRARSGAFPFELAYRLILMYSVYGDTVLDPFLGTGTTCAAALASMRHSVGIEIERNLEPAVRETLEVSIPLARKRIARRLEDHRAFAEARAAEGRPLKHRNAAYGFPVATAQERDLVLCRPTRLRALGDGRFEAGHEPAPLEAQEGPKPGQLDLFDPNPPPEHERKKT